MYPIECGFCGHDNPPNSKFCNSCGAPLTAAPCPHCGTVNDVMATLCQKCGASLADGQSNEFFLPLPPAAPVHPRSVLKPVESLTEPDAARRDTATVVGLPRAAPAADAGSATVSEAAPLDAPPPDRPPDQAFAPLPPTASVTPDSAAEASETTADRDAAQLDAASVAGPPPAAPAANAGAGLFQEGGAGGRRRRVPRSVAALVIMLLAVGVFYAYRYFQHFQPSDAAPRSAATPEATDRTIPPVSGKVKAPSEPGTPATAVNPPPAAPAPDRGLAATSEAKGGGGAPGKGSQISEPASGGPRPQSPGDIFVKSEPDPRRAPPQAQETTKAAAAGTDSAPRGQSTNAGAASAQRPPGSGACTDAVAALGLCTQKNTQGRKP